jgi:hypothetical protein
MAWTELIDSLDLLNELLLDSQLEHELEQLELLELLDELQELLDELLDMQTVQAACVDGGVGTVSLPCLFM